MIVFQAKLWPYGRKEEEINLGTAFVANVGTGTDTRGDYKVLACSCMDELLESLDEENMTMAINRRGDRGVWKKGTIENFPRKKFGVWDLMYRGLKGIVGERNEQA